MGLVSCCLSCVRCCVAACLEGMLMLTDQAWPFALMRLSLFAPLVAVSLEIILRSWLGAAGRLHRRELALFECFEVAVLLHAIASKRFCSCSRCRSKCARPLTISAIRPERLPRSDQRRQAHAARPGRSRALRCQWRSMAAPSLARIVFISSR